MIFVLLILLIGSTSSQKIRKKNIILFLTDDQDVELRSMEYMPHVNRLIRDRGVSFQSGFVSTPICCPSRSSILTGLYVHNHHVHTNNQNCSGEEWRSIHEPLSVGVHLQSAGYKTVYMGKYLNEYDGNYVPPGWSHWVGLVRNSRFYNYTLRVDDMKVRHGFDYPLDYLTDVIANRSSDWLARHLSAGQEPFAMVLSYPAPHGPEDPAPQYADMFGNVTSHITPSWNFAPNPDKQWLLRRTGKMSPVHVAFTDLLHRRRLQTLQSVDRAVHKVLQTLRHHDALTDTYIMYTSDHGYHIGQFGLIKGKNLPYEFDIRVPFLLRGPGIPKGVSSRLPVGNIDLVPTMLDIAGVERPEYMDGRSLLEAVTKQERSEVAPWRDTLLIERGKMPKMHKIRDRWLRQKARFSKEMRLNAECAKPEWHGKCGGGQQWKCHRAVDGRWRIYKCREWREREKTQHAMSCRCKREALANTIEKTPVVNEYEETEEDWERQFLIEAHEREVLKRGEWFQGVFGVQTVSTRRKRELCDCEGGNRTSIHPLKLDSVIDDGLYTVDEPLGVWEKKRQRRPSHRRPGHECAQPQMNCFEHSSSHWKTEPRWPDHYGQFCFCQNANNNTYWCLRTVNSTHNTLYCEFVTEFVSYYDLNEDPFQLTNRIFSLEVSQVEELSARLQLLRTCRGETCELYSRADWKAHIGENVEEGNNIHFDDIR